MDIFNHSAQTAIDIMLTVHQKGRAVCGVYTKEVAETKIMQVRQRAKSKSYPLRAIMEEE